LKGDYPKALDYLLRALKIDEEQKNKTGIASRLGSIGSVYWNQGDYEKALDHYLKALKMNEELGDEKGVATNLGNMGSVFIQQSELKKDDPAQRHDRESASPSVNTATARAPEVGWWGHSRVRMNTIAKSETTTARLQKVCMALIAGAGERLDQGDGRNRPAEHPQHCGAPYLILSRQSREPMLDQVDIVLNPV